MKIMVNSQKRSHASTATVHAPTLQQATTKPHLRQTHGHAQARLLWGHCSFLLGPGAQSSVCALQESFPQSYVCSVSSLGGLKVTSSKLMPYTHPEPRPCSRPLPTCMSIGDAQTQFCLSLCGVPGSWCTQGLFESSEHLWQEWSLILNANSPLLPSCRGFSLALGCRVSPHSHSSAYHLTGVSLTFDVGYLHMAGPAKCRHFSVTRCSS